MAISKYKIADIVFNMKQDYEETSAWYEPYLYTGKDEPLFTVCAKPEDIRYLCENGKDITPAIAENMMLCNDFNRYLARYSGGYIHSSAMLFDGKVYLFSGPSGVGKSTHTAKWLKRFGKRAIIINDDKPSFRLINDKCIIYGTPFAGGTDKQLNMSAELGALVFIEKATDNSIRKLSTAEAICRLLSQTPGQDTQRIGEARLDMYSVILSKYPVYLLSVNLDDSAVDTALAIINN